MKIAVLGGNGYVGQALIRKLSSETTHDIVSLSPNAETVSYENPRVSAKNIDVFDTDALSLALKQCDAVYYLIHMMGQKTRDFSEAEAAAAMSLIEATKQSSVNKIIFLGGLGDDSDHLSKHLASRHKTGEILRSGNAQVIEFRASMLVGKGSASYDIVANLVKRLPVLPLPVWAKTSTQPIGLDDATDYLVSALDISSKTDEIVEIGGPIAMTYEALLRAYAGWKGKKTRFLHVPFVPVWFASWWLGQFIPGKNAKVGRAMVESLINPMVVNSDRARELFPKVSPKPVEETFV